MRLSHLLPVWTRPLLSRTVTIENFLMMRVLIMDKSIASGWLRTILLEHAHGSDANESTVEATLEVYKIHTQEEVSRLDETVRHVSRMNTSLSADEIADLLRLSPYNRQRLKNNTLSMEKLLVTQPMLFIASTRTFH